MLLWELWKGKIILILTLSQSSYLFWNLGMLQSLFGLGSSFKDNENGGEHSYLNLNCLALFTF
jgi:hypothetical protein